MVFLYVPFTSNKGTAAALLATENAIAKAGSSDSGNLWKTLYQLNKERVGHHDHNRRTKI